jgi:Holliday junction DNA helicase RuvA
MIGRLAGRIVAVADDQVLIDVGGIGYEVHVSDRTRLGLPGSGQLAVLYTDLLVREDLMQLFGFATLAERDWHRALMTVQGIGAKASLAILGTLGAEGIARAILLGDTAAIRAAPGVGPKIAQRLVLELKAKAPALMARAASPAGALPPAPTAPTAPTSPTAPGADEGQPDPASGAATRPATRRTQGAAAAAASTAPPRAAAPSAAEDAAAAAASAADALSALVNLGYAPPEAAAAVAQASAGAPAGAGTGTAALIRAALALLQPRG